MSKYDDLFDATAPDDSVFADKGALDPLAAPDEVVARDAQERQLARLLNGVHQGYLPTTVSIYGPPGTGKTLLTRRLCRAFAARTDAFGYEYVNLKECQTLFSAANEILLALTGTQKKAYEGLDGVFAAIWDALEAYPEYVVLVLDEIDHIQQDSNYDPNDFFYRLLRGEGRLARDLHLSLFLVSNELVEVDLRLDSRVQSAMSGEEVFFPPYDADELAAVVGPRLDQAFQDGALPAAVRTYGVRQAADRWGDARNTLTLFRQAGETAAAAGHETVIEVDIADNLEATDRTAVRERLLDLPLQHFLVLRALAAVSGQGERSPATSTQVYDAYTDLVPADRQVGRRAFRTTVTDLETMGLLEAWVESRGRDGRVKYLAPEFDPQWVLDVQAAYFERDGAQPDTAE